jgi:uncharacterized protein (DUF1778 family)
MAEVKRLNINLDRQLHDHFKAAATMQGTNMTDVLLDFIRRYVEKNLPAALRKGSKKP